MTNRRKFQLGTGVAASAPLVSLPTAAASDALPDAGSDRVTTTANPDTQSNRRDMSNESQINQLLIRYTRGLDMRDEAMVAGVFLPNATITYELIDREFTSAVEFAHFLIAGLNNIATTQHYLSNVTVTVSGNEADSLSYVYVPSIRNNGTYILVGGQYEDKLTRTRSGGVSPGEGSTSSGP